MNRYWVLALFCVFHILIFLILFQGVFPDESEYAGYAEGDSRSLYYSYADKIFDGKLPYEDFDIEYQPLALPLFLLPRLFAESDIGYHIAFAMEMLFFDLIGLLVLWKLALRFKRSVAGILIIYTLGLLALGPTVLDHFDLAAAIMLLAAVYAFATKRKIIAVILIAIGTMIKVFPIIILPIFVIYLLKQRDFRGLITSGLAFALVLTIAIVPCLCINAGGFVDSFTYHSERGLQVESTYASALLLGHTWGISSVETDLLEESGSWDILTPTADTIASVSPLIMLFVLAATYGLYARRECLADSSNHTAVNERLFNYAVLLIVVFLVANKVFSPQYLIWLYPLVPLISGRWQIMHWCIYFTVGMMTMYIFSYHYDYIFSDHYLDLAYRLEAVPIYILTVRNLLLIGMALLLVEWRNSANRTNGSADKNESKPRNGLND